MEEDIENALNNLWNSLDDEFFNLTYSQEQMQEDIRLILNRYNYLDSKLQNLINKNKEQEKIIELMAKDIVENKLDEDICIQVKNLKKEECYACTYDGKDCSECVIEYYEKKAKGE